jgi:hypothetical protein
LTLPLDQVPQIAGQIMHLRQGEQQRLERIGLYVRGRHSSVYVPRGAKTEYKWLLERSVVNFLPLIVSVVSQNLHVDGYVPSGDEDGNPDPAQGPWQLWHANRWPSKQHGLHRSLAKYGVSYAVALPGQIAGKDQSDSNPAAAIPSAVMRPVSPRRLTALYEDDVDDDWPLYAVEVRNIASPKGWRRVIKLYDEQARYTLVTKENSEKPVWPEYDDPLVPSGDPVVAEHDMGICPVVRFAYQIDLDGELDVSGEVEPLIPLQDQLNTTTFNLLMAMQYAAFRQRWVTGMVPTDEKGRAKQPFRSGVDRLFVSESPDTRFGEFGQTSLDDILNSREASIRHMSTVAQVPPYHLLGQVANLSAEALAAARDGLDRKVEELQGTLNEPYKQLFRLGSKAAGDTASWNDDAGRVIWRDTGARAFAATVDALSKMASMLGVPVTELWKRVPGVSIEEVQAWQKAAEKQDALAELNEIVERALTKGQQPAGQNGAPAQMPTPDEPFQAYAGIRPGGV